MLIGRPDSVTVSHSPFRSTSPGIIVASFMSGPGLDLAGKHGRTTMIRKKWIDGEPVLSVETEDEFWKALTTGEAVELTWKPCRAIQVPELELRDPLGSDSPHGFRTHCLSDNPNTEFSTLAQLIMWGHTPSTFVLVTCEVSSLNST